jgi:hypothetical protein
MSVVISELLIIDNLPPGSSPNYDWKRTVPVTCFIPPNTQRPSIQVTKGASQVMVPLCRFIDRQFDEGIIAALMHSAQLYHNVLRLKSFSVKAIEKHFERKNLPFRTTVSNKAGIIGSDGRAYESKLLGDKYLAVSDPEYIGITPIHPDGQRGITVMNPNGVCIVEVIGE